ncbi:DUF4230 domain-containing protein [Actinospica durhamensis]|uniref:DUF4230 domain-containing protein n=1 Tax=Actinospica durhamensis TaxID=1508375 RepID=A0A941IKT3_9ACTN|nr:DUF4230 domain-containing protein [Actinospica durhamensis]MBR7832200.1 DUF4230 domain-containing protein [Actinospica durhamensis]
MARLSEWRRRFVAGGIALVVAVGLVLVGSAIHLLPQLRNPFSETTTERSGPVLLQSIVQLSKYEAASGTFQVVVDISSGGSILPSFLEGSDTLFIGVGTENSYVDFSKLKGQNVQVSADRLTAALTLPKAQLEAAQLNVQQSYVFAQQQGLFTRVNSFLSGNPNSQQAVYELAQKQIEGAAAKSQLVADAEKNTTAMLTSLLESLGFKNVSVKYTG